MSPPTTQPWLGGRPILLGNPPLYRKDPVRPNLRLLLVLVCLAVVLPGSPAFAAPGPTDLSVAVTDTPDPVYDGKALSYTTTVANLGPADATSVVMTFNLSGWVTNATSSATQGSCTSSSNTYTCSIGLLASGSSADVTIAGAVIHVGEIQSTASVTAAESDINPTNNSETETTTVVPAADVDVKLFSATPVEAGFRSSLTVNFHNSGQSQAANAEGRVALPATGATIGTIASSTSAVCVRQQNELVCTLGTMELGTTSVVTIPFTPTGAGSLTFSSTISTTTTDLDTTDNAATKTVDVTASALNQWRSHGSGPAGLWGASSAYDPLRQRLVLFGGFTQTGISADTWLWDGQQWSKANPAVSPSPRAMSAMAFNPVDGTIVLVGGTTQTAPTYETWTWDGTTWRQATWTGTVLLAPRIAFDGLRLVMFGGWSSGVESNATYLWTGSTWTLANTPVAPPGRDSHALVEDPVNGGLVLFGGCCDASDNFFSDTWTWNGSAWRQRNVAGPSSRADMATAFDQSTGTATIIGGLDNNGTDQPDVWSWTGEAWVLRGTSGAPAARDGATLSFAPNTGLAGRLVLSGGEDQAGNLLNQTASLLLAPEPRAVVSPSSLSFGSTLTGATSAPRTVTVGNAGGAHLTGPSAIVTGDFIVASNTCTGASVPPGGTCTVGVSFRPGWVGTRNGTLSIGGKTVSLTGTGTAISLTTPGLVSGVSINATFPVSWMAAGGSGVVYDVQWTERYRAPSGAWLQGSWKTWKSGTTATSAWFGGSGQPPSYQGRTYLFQVRARRANEIGSWSAIRSAVVPFDERTSYVIYSSGWSSVTSSGRYYGTLRQASTAGRTLQLATEGNMLYLVGDRCPTCGAFDVYVDGVKVTRVDTYAKTTAARQVLFSRYTTGGIKRHTLKIVVAGTAGRPTVRIDGIAMAR